MKTHIKISFLFILLISGGLKVFSQQQQPAASLPIDADSKKIMYRGVVDQQGTMPYLYNKAIEWFGFYYVNAQSVYTVQDKENGKIEGIGRMKIFYMDEKNNVRVDGGLIMYQIKLELRENKYRYTLTDFNLKAASKFPIEKWLNKSDPAYNSKWDSYLYQIDTTMQRLVVTLKEKMKPTVVKKDEW
jgi:Domain of unknown function (DUF4468) with TBP-like fold